MTETKKKMNSYLKFLLWLAIGGCIGAVMGVGMVIIGKDMGNVLEHIRTWIGMHIIILQGIMVVLSLLIGGISYKKGETVIQKLQVCSDDEEQDILECKYNLWGNIGMTGTTIIIYVSLALLAFALHDLGEFRSNLWAAALLLAVTIIAGSFQVAFVKQLCRKDPMKHADATDLKFEKDWLESCDEAERQMIYKAGYKAFSVTKTVLMGAVVIAMMGEMFFSTGLTAVILLTISNIISVCVYTYHSVKLEKNGVK